MGLLLLAAFTAAFAMIAERLSSTIITAPMTFIGFGVLMSTTGLLPTEGAEAALHIVAEIALILLLFLDAAQIDANKLLKEQKWPTRMLLLGLPLSIGIGTLSAWLLLPDWTLPSLALLAAILAPTDAALGQPVVSNPAVPEKSRQSLITESGLNDGLALPAILLFASLAAHAADTDETNWLAFAALQLSFGPLVGIAMGWLGGKGFLYAQNKGLTAGTFEGISAVSLAATSYLAAVELGGNGFISAFAAGLAFGSIVKGRCMFVYEFTEGEGQLISWGAFFLLGFALVPQAFHHLDGNMLALILISLFLVRPLAIWLSLMGTDAPPITRLFFGWFGPRGLATALFALVVVAKLNTHLTETVLMVAVNAVWMSALLHGITAVPFANLYGKIINSKN